MNLCSRICLRLIPAYFRATCTDGGRRADPGEREADCDARSAAAPSSCERALARWLLLRIAPEVQQLHQFAGKSGSRSGLDWFYCIHITMIDLSFNIYTHLTSRISNNSGGHIPFCNDNCGCTSLVADSTFLIEFLFKILEL